jgi:outer membrane receptor for ferrienterochelin and colicins
MRFAELRQTHIDKTLMISSPRRALYAAIASALFANALLAETAPPPSPAPPAAPTPAPASEPIAAPEAPVAPITQEKGAPGTRVDRVAPVEVTGKNTANDERRNASAAKIIITREDLEQYGDSNLGEAMRRLPGVTTGGRPGRPGAPQMRGMGGGFTQILLDGQRIPPGFSVEQITPDQVDRIEILRAPTAETGARAIAGTINIILREPLRQTNNELKAGVQEERGKYSPNASWTRNGTIGETATYNVTASAGATNQLTDNRSRTTYEDLATGAKALEQLGFNQSDDHRENYFLSGRAQWRLGAGEQFGIQSFLAHNSGENHSTGTLEQPIGDLPLPYATRKGSFEGRFDVGRLNLNLNKRFDESTRYELRGGLGKFWSNTDSINEQFATDGARALIQTSRGDVRDTSWNLSGKVIRNVGGSSHAVTAGWEIEDQKRDEKSITLLNGVQQLAELGETFDVSTRRFAAYLQDEWDITPEWGANAGIRYETIRTASSNAQDNFTNTSRVLTPLAHLVWRFASPSRDQVRLSLTQSYRSPSVQQLTSRPSLNTLYPVPGANTAVSPDRAGNPNLKPERANGIDLAFERYLKSGGVMSVNFFVRDIKDLIRNVTALEDVSWANEDRYVNRPQNLGKAITKGVEFDAKFQLKELIEDSIPLNLRFNLSVYDSKVASVIGPYNRIDQQPRASGNFGADYKFRSAPISLGGNLGWTPAYTTQLNDTQLQKVSTKRVFDAYALWTINPMTKLRLSLSNISPIDATTIGVTLADGQRQTVVSDGRTDMSIALRLEMRL